MTTLTRRDPVREMLTLRSAMSRLFDDAFQSLDMQPQTNGHSTFALALDVSENDDEYRVQASVPGVAEEDLDITLQNHVLTIAGELKAQEQEGVQYHLRERRHGRFSRSITLPSAINADAIAADFENGVLTVHLPKVAEAKPRRIAVHGQKTIEAKAS